MAMFTRRTLSTAQSVARGSAVQFKAFGHPKDVLRVTTVPNPGKLSEKQVAIKMWAAPIHPVDFATTEGFFGKTQFPAVAGSEGVGEVLEVGSGVKSLKRGDPVVTIAKNPGTWQTHLVLAEKDVVPVSPKLKPEFAALLTVAPCAALRLLTDFVKLKPGDVVIQNAANGAVGLSVAQLAASMGLKTINVVRNRPNYPEIVERLKSHGGYVVVHDEYIRTRDYQKLVSDLPAPRLALDGVGDVNATNLARVLADGATMVTYGNASRRPIPVPASLLISKDIKLQGFNLSKWVEQHSREEYVGMIEHIQKLMLDGKFRVFTESFKFENFPNALDAALDRIKSRKVVIRFY